MMVLIMKTISIFDSTLREGEQAPGNAMTVEEKIKMILAIDAMGVQYIEIGFPAASPNDFLYAKQVAHMRLKAVPCCLSRANKEDIDAVYKAFEGTRLPQIEILSVGSEIHLKYKRHMTIKKVVEEITEAILYAQSLGFKDIAVAFEDTFRGSQKYLRTIIEACVHEGAGTLMLADTVGASTPREVFELVHKVREWVGESVTLSIHCHNDMGLAIANSLAAVEAGVNCIQTTLCGFGERTGIAPLEEIAAIFHYKSHVYDAQLTVDLKKIYQACSTLTDILQVTLSPHTPIIGENAFSSATGIHLNGLLRNPITYEFVEPHLFGCQRKLLISRLSGRKIIEYKLNEMNLPVEKRIIELMYKVISSAPSPEDYNNEAHFKALYEEVKK